jgi:hypothetical protein
MPWTAVCRQFSAAIKSDYAIHFVADGKEEAARARPEGVLSSRTHLTMPAILSRDTVTMFGWFRTTSGLTNPSGVPIFNISSYLPKEEVLSIPKIFPPALRTTRADWLFASAILVVSWVFRSEWKLERPRRLSAAGPVSFTAIGVCLHLST